MLTLIFIARVQSQDAVGGSCGLLDTDTFTFLDMAKKPFCFKFNNYKADTTDLPDDPVINSTFFYFGTQVDQYSLIQLKESNMASTDRWVPLKDVSVEIEAGGITSSPMYARKYVDNTLWIFNQLSLVVVSSEGTVSELIW